MDFEVLKKSYADWGVSDFKIDSLQLKTRLGLQAQLKKQLQTGFAWVLVLSILYIVLSLVFPEMIVIIFSIMMISFNMAVAYPMRRIYSLLNGVSEAEATLSYVERLLDLYERWYAYQNRILKWVLPLITIYGGCLGAYSANPAALSLDSLFGPLGGILVVVSIPLSLLGNRLFKWMYSHSYGKNVSQLRCFYADLMERHTEIE